jgi:hypothetical protein
MAKVQRADPAARRQAVLFVAIGALVGALLMVGFERYHTPLRDWILSEPEQSGHRLRIVFLLSAACLSAPLFGFAAYLWSFGGKVLHAQQFPPPGHRVIRDTPNLQGQAAISRGRSFKILAVCLGVACALLWFLFWRLVSAIISPL